jgi:hypothetical protein
LKWRGGKPAVTSETFLTRIFSSRLGALTGVLGICAIVLIGYTGWRYMSAEGGKRDAKGPARVSVSTQTIQNSDFPVYLNGLGIVQPYNTVTVRSRVDGQVDKVGQPTTLKKTIDHGRGNLRTIYPIADRHLVADGGCAVRRPRRLSATACGTSASG